MILIVVAILIISVILHEVSHGLVAKMFGDTTAKEAGRLTLNPIPHIDLFGSIILPLAMILLGSPILMAWAKPVPIDPGRFSRFRLGMFCVSIAGVLTNLILAVTAGLAIRIFSLEAGLPFFILLLTVMINLSLALFNLVPIPPLDGFKMLASILGLPEKVQAWFDRKALIGFLLIYLLFLATPLPRIAIKFVGLLVKLLTGANLFAEA